MKKIIISLLVIALSATVAFANGADDGDAKATGSAMMSETLRINHAQGNNARTMTYQKSDPLTLPDGTVISQGDLKPTWQHISKEIGVQVVDVTVQDQKATEMIDIAAATSFGDAVIFGGNSIAQELMDYGAQGYFVNLKDHMDQMPDIKAYLDAKPNVAKAVTAYNGGIYHMPYVAEIGNYARVYCARGDWVTALLDSDSAIEKENHTLNVAYEGYWDRNKTNVVDLQNNAARGGVLDAATARKVLIDYIDDTYPNLSKRSDLFLGETSFYDIDELIALWRVVELSPRTLSKVSTGSIVEDAEISPYFVRKSSYREDLLRMLNYFEGQRVHGGDSYTQRLYDNGKGNLAYSYAEKDFLEKVNYVQQWYSEGLIHSEFYDLSVKDEFRKSMYFADSLEGQKQFGFMTFDWIASTTAGSDKITAVLPPVTTIPEAGINEFIHYVENTRAIKNDGWAISAKASEEEINAALKLFNYMFTEEGNNVQNYSIPAARVEGEVFTGPDGIDYPKFSPWILQVANEYKNGDISGFLRDFMGSHLALGYQKEIGFETQYTKNQGFDSWALYNGADVLTQSYEADHDFLRMMPPAIALNEQNLAKLTTVSVGDGQVEKIFMYITGLDSSIADATDILADFEEAGIDTYLSIYETAYYRMMGK